MRVWKKSSANMPFWRKGALMCPKRYNTRGGVRVEQERKKLARVFASRLAELMEQRGIKAIDLAARLKVHQSRVSRWLSGEQFPKIETLPSLAEILGVTVDYLLGASDHPQEYVRWNADLEERLRWHLQEAGFDKAAQDVILGLAPKVSRPRNE